MSVASKAFTGTDHQQVLVPQKFCLIVVQLILLIILLDLKRNFIYWYGLNKVHSIFLKEPDALSQTPEYLQAEQSLQAAVFSFIFFLVFEVAMLLVGVGLMFSSLTFLQNFLHFLGCLFTVWFLLDSWQFQRIWWLWGCFGAFPFAIELYMIVASARFSRNAHKNVHLESYFSGNRK